MSIPASALYRRVGTRDFLGNWLTTILPKMSARLAYSQHLSNIAVKSSKKTITCDIKVQTSQNHFYIPWMPAKFDEILSIGGTATNTFQYL